MVGGRRAAERAREQAARLGHEVQVARLIADLSRNEAASRAGVARSTWERIEAGSPGVALGTLVAATAAVGLDLVVRTYPRSGPQLRDHGQLKIAGDLARMAAPSWRVDLEVAAGEHGQAIDMVFWSAEEILALEIERRMIDYQAQLRAASLKRDWLAGKHARPVRLVLAIEDTHRNRETMALHLPLMRMTFPLGSRAVMGAIRGGRPLGADGLLWIRQR